MLRILISTITMLILDGLWLGFIAKKLYLQEIGSLLRMSPKGGMDPLWLPALIVYVALIAGVLLFAIPKAQGSALNALIWGAIFGLICYAVYDFTNLAVLANWSWKMSIIDTLWGMVLCGLTSFLTVLIAK